MKRFVPLAAVVLLGQIVAGCTGRALGPGEARLTVSGKVQVASPGRGWQTVQGNRTLHRGERVQVLQGLAQVRLSNDRQLELRRGSEIVLQSSPSLTKGDALAVAKESALPVEAGAATARVRRGAAHVSRGLGTTAASYTGELAVESAGRQLGVPALRQATVPGPGLVPANAVPLDYRADNPWDRRYLGDAIDLGEDLQARSQGFTAQLSPDEGKTAGFYRQLLPPLETEPGFGQELLDPAVSAGDTLVGAAISVQSHKGDFSSRWRDVFSFRGQGARWGLVALDQRVTRAPLLSGIDEALARLTPGTVEAALPAGAAPALIAGAVPADQAAAASGGGGGPAGQVGGPPATTAPKPGGGGGGGLLPGVPPLVQPPPGTPTTSTTTPPPGPVGGLIEGVGNVVGGLLGGLVNPRG
jgi:hypothetical protein